MADDKHDYNIFIYDALSFININLELYLKEFAGENIIEPMLYSISAGGKRFRALLILLTYKSLNKLDDKNLSVFCKDDFNNVLPFITAIEFIHTYSLIHDDLPCMDNDDFRRGMPTCHKAFDEATAVLAGDALLNTAFEIMLEKLNTDFNKKFLNAIQVIASASGSKGMIDGQVIDMYNQDLNTKSRDINKNNQDLEKVLLNMYKNKTGELISTLKCLYATN